MSVGGAGSGQNQQGGAYGGGGLQGGYGGASGSAGTGGGDGGGWGGGSGGDASGRGGGQSVTSAVGLGLGLGTSSVPGQGASNANDGAVGNNSNSDGGRSNSAMHGGVVTTSNAASLGLANQSKTMAGGSIAKAAEAYNRGYDYSDAQSNFGTRSAVLGQLGNVGGGLINTALSFVPGYNTLTSIVDAAEKSNRGEKLGVTDAARVAVSLLPGSGLIKAGVMTAAQLADGDSRGAASTAAGTAGSVIGQNVGYSIGGLPGSIAGGLIGGLGGSALAGGTDSSSASSGGNNNSRGGNAAGRVSESVYGSTPKVAATAPVAQYADYAMPQAQLINPMEFV